MPRTIRLALALILLTAIAVAPAAEVVAVHPPTPPHWLQVSDGASGGCSIGMMPDPFVPLG